MSVERGKPTRKMVEGRIKDLADEVEGSSSSEEESEAVEMPGPKKTGKDSQWQKEDDEHV